jgi:hypothetical protein
MREKYPLAQERHDDMPIVGAYVSAEQREQADAPDAEYLPG